MHKEDENFIDLIELIGFTPTILLNQIYVTHIIQPWAQELKCMTLKNENVDLFN